MDILRSTTRRYAVDGAPHGDRPAHTGTHPHHGGIVDRQTAHRTIRTHQPGWWWKLLGRNRCRDCHRRWPCNTWLSAIDQRDDTIARAHLRALAAEMRRQTQAGVLAMTDTIPRRPSDELAPRSGGAANQGRWS